MSSKERIGIILDVDAEVSKAKGNIGSLSKIFDGIGGSKGNQLRDLLSDISAEYEKLANESGKTMSKVGDFTKAEKSSERLSQLLRRLDKEIGSIGKSSKGDLSKFFPPEVADRVKKASDAVKTYNTILENSSKKKGAIGAAADEYKKQEKAVKDAAAALKDLQDIQNGTSKKKVVSAGEQVIAQDNLNAAKARAKELKDIYKALKEEEEKFKVEKQQEALSKGTKSMFDKGTENHSKPWTDLQKKIAAVKADLDAAANEANQFNQEIKNMVVSTNLKEDIKAAKTALTEAQGAADKLKENLDNVTAAEFSRAFDEAKKKLEGMSGIDLSEITNIDDLNNLLQRFTNEGIQGLEDGLRKAGVEIRDLGNANTEVEGKVRSHTAEIERQNRAIEDVNGIKNRVLQFFSLTNAMQLGRQAIRQTIETVKELDKSMTETAVVTNFSVGDMWDQLPQYTDMAREYGVAIKGVYDASTLYYQQGLNQEQTMQLTGETLKMARIAGLDYAEATDLMTAALRGFNMELNETNATRINDVYSELAAITAADTEEIATAMTKTASIASSANMEFETTAALLSQIIETTREPAETAGTAMKTIIARFTEMKKATSDIVNIDGEEVNVNKVEAALKSAGVALRDANGEFRDLDDVFLELSSKWNSLDVMTQRYVATMAAGSRQQSRFIAMMQNYDRTMELVDAAYNSTGASANQFGKTQESLETKIANLEAAWQEFLMGISNSEAIKGIIDILTGLINALNEATTGVGGFSTFMLRMFSVVATFKIGKGIFNKIFASINTELFQGGTQGGSHLVKGISQGTHKNFGEFAKSLKKNITSKVKSIFKTTKMVPKIPINFDFGEKGSIGVKEFAKTLSSQLTPEQLGDNNTLKSIGATLEASVKSSLAAHGLQDEGTQWANGLGKSFVSAMKNKGADIQTVIAEIMAKVKAQVANSKVDIELNDDDSEKDPNAKVKNQQKDDFVKDVSDNDFQIDDEMLEKTEDIKANVMGIGTALTTASMAANMVTSALAESGAISETTASTFLNLSNSLSTAGTLMMALKAASDMFNISANMNPYIIAISALIAGVVAFSGAIKQAAEDEKKANEERVKTAQESQAKLDTANSEIEAYKELLDAYKETGEGAAELQTKKEELIKTLELEKYGVNALTSSYEDVIEAAIRAQKEMSKTNRQLQEAGLSGAVANSINAGKKGWGGAGYANDAGSQFEIDIGSGEFNTLKGLITRVAAEEGVTGLTFDQGAIDKNLQIGGIGTSPEEQRIWMKIMHQVLQEYQTSLGDDASNSRGYQSLQSYWGNVSEYYTEAEETNQNLVNTEFAEASETAKGYVEANKISISSLMDFQTQVDNIIKKLGSYENLSDQQKQMIAVATLQEMDSNLADYGTAYTQILRLANDSTKQDFLSFIETLNGTDIRLLADLDVQIEDGDTFESVERKLNFASVYDAMFGQVSRMSNLVDYGDKLLSGEEITDDEKEEMTNYISQDYGFVEAKQWEQVQDEDVSTQLKFFEELAEKKEAEVDAAHQAYEDYFDEQVVKGLEYGEIKEGETKSQYTKDKEYVEQGQKLVNDIKALYSEDTGQYSAISDELQGDIEEFYNIKKRQDGDNLLTDANDFATALNNYNTNVKAAQGTKLWEQSTIDTMAAEVDYFIQGYRNTRNSTRSMREAANANLSNALKNHAPEVYNYYYEDIKKNDFSNIPLSSEMYATVPDVSTDELAGAFYNFYREVELSIAPEQELIDSYDKSYESVMARAGFTSQNIWSDYDQSGSIDYADSEKLLNGVETAFKAALAAEKLNEKNDESVYNVQEDGTKTFKTPEQYKADVTVQNAEPNPEILEQLEIIEQAEKEGYHITVETDDDGVQKTLVKIDDLKDAEGNPLELEIDMNTDQLEDVLADIDSLDGRRVELVADIKQASAEAAEATFNSTLNSAQNLNNALDLMNEKYQVPPENVEQLRQIFPELMKGADVLNDGTLQLNKNLVDTFSADYAKNLDDATQNYIDKMDVLSTETAEEAQAYQDLVDGTIEGTEDEIAAQEDKAKQYIETALEKERQGALEAETTEKNTNLSIDAAAASALAQTTSLDEINVAIQTVATNYRDLWLIAGGDTSIDPRQMSSVLVSNGGKDAYKDFVDTNTWVTSDQIIKAAAAEDTNNDGKITADDLVAAGIVEDKNGNGDLTDEAGAVLTYTEIFYNQAEEDIRNGEDNEIDKIVAESQSKAESSELKNGPKSNKDDSGSGSGSKGSKAENETNATVKNIDQKLSELDRQLENNQIDAVEYKRQRDELLGGKGLALSNQLLAEQNAAKYYGEYYYYDNEAQAYLYNTEAYDTLSDETKNEVDKEISKLNEINDEVKKIRDEMADYEFRFQGNEQKYYDSYYGSQNDDSYLANLDRKRGYLDRERELVGKLPEEMQGPLNMALLGQDMVYEAQEIQYNRSKLAETQNMRKIYEQEAHFFGTGEDDYYYYDEATDSYMWYQDRMANEFLDEDTRKAIEDEYNKLNEKLQEENAIEDELYGGVIQDAFRGMAKASKTVSKSLKEQDKATDHLNDAFNELEKKLGLGEDALDGFAKKIGGAIQESEFLKKEVKGLGIKDAEEKVNNSAIAGLLSDDQKTALTQILGEGGTIGDIGGSLFGGGSDFLNSIGDFLNFDMMSLGLDMFNGMKGMMDQGKQMVEKIIGYITQATQVIVDAWTNREDYLYNFLKVIEKHLQEYEKLQRYQNQLEKGRTSTVEEIRANYDKQWQSLQQQLEEQQERLETRQKELERSRWNPFSLISGWNPSSDALYENREVKFLWDLIIGLGEAFAPFGTGAFFSQLNQLYEDYDKRVQQSYEDRLAAEQALLDIEDERLELVKYGSEEATEFESKILEAMVRKEQEQIDELTRLNDAITDANSKLISTLQDNLEKMRQDRENEKKEEELSEKERRLAYLRQDTSGANMLEIKKLEEQLEEEHEDYTDTLIDQKISELEKQNEKAAEQRQQQIDLLQSQLDYAEKYGLYWDAIYGMLYTIDENGNAVLNPENFDIDGNIRENSELAQMLGTFSDRLGMSVWSAVLDNEEMKRLGRYYGFFIGNNGVTGKWRHQWALDDPGADDPNFAYPEQEIPEGLWGVLYRLEIGIKKYFANSDSDLIDRGGRIGQAFKNFFGKLFGNEEWANYEYEAVNPSRVQSTTFAGMKKLSDDTKEWFKSLFSSNESYGNKTSRNLTGNGAQNIGDINTTNYFQIGKVGETISLDEMVDQVAEKFRDMFSIGNNILGRNRT